MRRTTIRCLAATAAAVSLTMSAGCSSGSVDRAGGAAGHHVTVLRLANLIGEPPGQVAAFADEVRTLSDRGIRVEIRNEWRAGRADAEALTIDDVRRGRIAMAWVGARAFDRAGVDTFQPLLAPMLVDSQDLQAQVFRSGLPAAMLPGLRPLQLHGLAALPGPMRKVLGVDRPFVTAADFKGQVVGVQDSALTAATMRALGAVTKKEPGGASLDGLNAYEQQLASIVGNRYNATARYVTANLDLWPRPLVIIMGDKTFDRLTPAQRRVLEQAGKAAVPAAIAETKAEDASAARELCALGMHFPAASTRELGALRAAVQPVYDKISQNPANKAVLDRIVAMKQELGAPPDAVTCSSGTVTAAGIPNGTYRTRLSSSDWACWFEPLPGVFTMTVGHGAMTLVNPDGQIGYQSTYSILRDRITANGPPDVISATWSVHGNTLRFADVKGPEPGGCDPYVIVWSSHPWTRVVK